jgi:hypothetical protein
MEEPNYSKFTVGELSKLLSQLNVNGRGSATTKDKKIKLLKNFSCVSERKSKKTKKSPKKPKKTSPKKSKTPSPKVSRSTRSLTTPRVATSLPKMPSSRLESLSPGSSGSIILTPKKRTISPYKTKTVIPQATPRVVEAQMIEMPIRSTPPRIVVTPPRLPTPPIISARAAVSKAVTSAEKAAIASKYYERMMNNILNKTKVKGILKKATRLEIVDDIAELLQLNKIKEGEWEIGTHLAAIASGDESIMAKNLVENLYNAAKEQKKNEFIETLEMLNSQIPQNLTYIAKLK